MIFERAIAHTIREVSDRTRARVAFGRRVGKNVRIVGRASVVHDGEIRVGDDVVIVSSPAPVTIVAHQGASIEIGDGAIIESGAVIRAHDHVVIAPGARIAAGTIIDDEVAAAEEVAVSSTALDRVRAIVAGVVTAAEEAGSGTDVRTLVGWDSLTALRVIVSLEKELGVTLPHDLFAEPRTLASLASLASNP
ncbi:MAG TPA: phosphopantetheine-binding protein [Polyangiaceae bacterium]|jgi:acyl carrier protein